MKPLDNIAAANQNMWEAEVQKEGGYTRPWLDLDVGLLQEYANGRLDPAPFPLYVLYSANLLQDVAGKSVLCLATGGGQQSAILGLLGATVTVADLTQGQLDGDEKAATHYGYPVTTIQADMRDLSALAIDSFDLVFQADSLAYIPELQQVYKQVSRVLRPGGLYRVAQSQPAIHFTDWDGAAYRISAPYAETIYNRPDGGIEFRHRMDDIFNGLLDTGFAIRRIYEAPYYQQSYADKEPGSWGHEQRYIAGGFTVIARKIEGI